MRAGFYAAAAGVPRLALPRTAGRVGPRGSPRPIRPSSSASTLPLLRDCYAFALSLCAARGRRRGPRAGDVPAGAALVRRLRAGHEREGVAVHDPAAALHRSRAGASAIRPTYHPDEELEGQGGRPRRRGPARRLRHVEPGDVVRLLEEVPEPFRMAVRLRDLDGLTYQEIGRVLGVPPGTVMSRIHRGRECLKALFVDPSKRGRDATRRPHERLDPLPPRTRPLPRRRVPRRRGRRARAGPARATPQARARVERHGPSSRPIATGGATLAGALRPPRAPRPRGARGRSGGRASRRPGPATRSPATAGWAAIASAAAAVARRAVRLRPRRRRRRSRRRPIAASTSPPRPSATGSAPDRPRTSGGTCEEGVASPHRFPLVESGELSLSGCTADASDESVSLVERTRRSEGPPRPRRRAVGREVGGHRRRLHVRRRRRGLRRELRAREVLPRGALPTRSRARRRAPLPRPRAREERDAQPAQDLRAAARPPRIGAVRTSRRGSSDAARAARARRARTLSRMTPRDAALRRRAVGRVSLPDDLAVERRRTAGASDAGPVRRVEDAVERRALDAPGRRRRAARGPRARARDA